MAGNLSVTLRVRWVGRGPPSVHFTKGKSVQHSGGSWRWGRKRDDQDVALCGLDFKALHIYWSHGGWWAYEGKQQKGYKLSYSTRESGLWVEWNTGEDLSVYAPLRWNKTRTENYLSDLAAHGLVKVFLVQSVPKPECLEWEVSGKRSGNGEDRQSFQNIQYLAQRERKSWDWGKGENN